MNDIDKEFQERFKDAVDTAALLDHKVLAWVLTTSMTLLQAKDPELYAEITKTIDAALREAERRVDEVHAKG